MAKARFASVADYLAAQPAPARKALVKVRRAIRTAVPAAEEGIAYQMPVYRLNGVPVIYFAGWTAHYSLYPASDALVATFARELEGYERRKGTIRIPLSEPVPEKLIERLVRFRAGQIAARDRGKGHRTRGRDAQLARVRRLCGRLPSVSEKESHGTPAFFVEQDKGVFAMFADNHHEDGRLALWVPVAEGLQPLLIEEAPATYFKPPYVGAAGWVGIRLDAVRDDALQAHLREAWDLVARKRKPRQHGSGGNRAFRPASEPRKGTRGGPLS